MDPYAAALGVSQPPPRVSPVAGIVTPDQQQPDTFDGSPADVANLKWQLAKTTDPAARADLQNALAKKATAPDPYALALGIAPPPAAPVAARPAAPVQPGPNDSSLPVSIQNRPPTQEVQAPTWWQKAQGLASAATSMVTAPIGDVAAAIDLGAKTGIAKLTGQDTSQFPTLGQAEAAGAERFTYRPADPGAQDVAQNILQSGAVQTLPAIAALGPGFGAGAKLGAQTARDIARAGPPSLQDALTASKAAPTRVEPAMGAVPKPRYQLVDGKPQLVTAANAAPATVPAPVVAPTIAQASPEFQRAVANAQTKGAPLAPEVVARHVEAETLPVPVKLTLGQATLDPEQISAEMNGRGKGAQATVPPEFYKQQGQALAQNVDAIRASAAPDVPATASVVDHGQTLLDTYKKMDAPIQADISSKYKALEDAAGGSFPIDGQTFVANTESALDKALKAGSVPPDIQSSLNAFKSGRQMTFQDFESMRSDLADVQRSATDGRQRAAAGIIRQQLEDMPLTPEAAALKPLADQARAAAKARFDAIDSDPAYKAAVNDSVPAGDPSPLADKFFNAYVTKGARANVNLMQKHLADEPLAAQTIAAGTLDSLKGQFKPDLETGNFSQAGLNKGLESVGPKLDALLDPKSAQQIQAVANTAKLAQTQPRGSFVNNSNTLVGMAAEGAKAAATHGTNILFHGIPVGSVARAVGGKVMDNLGASNAAKKALAPGAGITKLSEFPK